MLPPIGFPTCNTESLGSGIESGNETMTTDCATITQQTSWFLCRRMCLVLVEAGTSWQQLLNSTVHVHVRKKKNVLYNV